MDIATLIKEYRTKTGMTQQELADKVFVSRQTISKWELGKSEPDKFSPSILIIRLLVLKIGKIENKRLVILINTLLFIIIGIYLKSLKDNVYFVFLGIIAISYSLYSFYKLSLEIKKD